MKTTNFDYSTIRTIALTLYLTVTISSCGTKTSKEETAEQTEKGKEADGQKQDSVVAPKTDNNGPSANEGDNASIMWMASEQPFSGQLKLIEGDVKMLNPTINANSDGSKVLGLSLSGERVLLLFDDMFENVGSNLQFKTDGFQGQVAIVHHYIDASNYDYLSLANSSMQLGRMENGKDNVFDKRDNKMLNDWSTLRLSAAGEHYKGYLNDKLVNHGHAEAMAAGRVGILMQGKGKIMLKMLEVVKLSE